CWCSTTSGTRRQRSSCGAAARAAPTCSPRATRQSRAASPARPARPGWARSATIARAGCCGRPAPRRGTPRPTAAAARPPRGGGRGGAVGMGLIGGYLAAPERGLFGDVFGDLSEQAFAELVDPRTRLALAERRLGAARAEPTTLEETILLSLEGLPDPVRRAFFALGAFEPMPARFSREAAEAVTGASGRVLALLAARHLLQVEEEGRQLTLHRTVSDAARTRPDPGAAARHRAHYFGLVASGRNRHDKWLVADHY